MRRLGVSSNLQRLFARGFAIAIIFGNLMFLFWISLPDESTNISFDHSSKLKHGRSIDYYYNGYKVNDKYNSLSSVFNSSNVTLSNRKLRRPYSHKCDRPVGFPGGPPRIKRLKKICREYF